MYSIYESLDDLRSSSSSPTYSSPNPTGINDRPRLPQRHPHYGGSTIERKTQRRSCCSNFCSCIKSALIIAACVAVFLGLFVVLPLKVIFVQRDKEEGGGRS